MTTIEIFARNLRYYRLKYDDNGNIKNKSQAGLSQEKLAELTGFTSHYISDLERCRYGATFEALDIFSMILGIPVYLFFVENPAANGLQNRIDMYRKIKI